MGMDDDRIVCGLEKKSYILLKFGPETTMYNSCSRSEGERFLRHFSNFYFIQVSKSYSLY